ncbi:MAG: VWA domain-containing protein [Muribaculaceae bacterium]
MNTENNTSIAKTTVFNLIILDESGSMYDLKKATISGCNETLNVIRGAQKQAGDRQRHLVSIYAFQSGSVPSRYLIKNVPVAEVNNLTDRDYEPCGCTPLYDAVGMTLADLEAIANTHEDATAVVTIITDGYENSSTEYTGPRVAKMIETLKEKGWTFNFIGANIDVEQVSRTLKIDNAMSWTSDEKGTTEMYGKFKACYSACMDEMVNEDAAMPLEARIEERKKRSRRFFGK